MYGVFYRKHSRSLKTKQSLVLTTDMSINNSLDYVRKIGQMIQEYLFIYTLMERKVWNCNVDDFKVKKVGSFLIYFVHG